MADVRIQQYPQKSIVSDNDIFLIADSNDVDVNGFLKYKKVRAKDLPSIVNTAESITYANLIASIAADDLIIGTFYKITDSTSGVSPLLVQAVGVDAIGYLAFDAANPLVTINYDVITDTIRWSLNQTVAPISLGSLSATTPLSYNNTTGVFTISQSNTTTNGFLSSADWNTFTAKQNALSGTGIVKSTGGTISYLTDNSTNWNTAYNDSIVSAGVTGTSTKTLTLNQQDGGTVTASWSDADTGLTSVGLTMPSAFSVANSPLTSNGTLAVTGAGVASQYVRGDGTLAAFPTSTGGGSSVSYYFNGGTSQGTIGGNTYYEMSETAVIGTGADFNINANGYIAQFVTDANDPALLTIPAGNWNFEMWFSASSGGGSPSFYLELYKYDGATLTLISSGSAVPESITGGTAIDLYTTALAVPTTALTITDRLAVRVFVNNSSRTITLHTQNGHLCQAITTFSTGLTALNGLTNQVQYLAVGTSGTDFGISSATSTHTFNLPTASAANRGALSSADWTTFNNKQNALTNPITGTGTTNYLPKFTGASALGDSLVFDNGTNVGIGTPIPNNKLQISALDLSNIIGSSNASININNTGASFGNTSDLIFTIADGNANFKVGAICSVYNTYSTSVGGDLVFLTNNGLSSLAEKMRITSGGNVGIGTTTPSEELEVYKSQNGITRLLVNNPDTTNTNSRAAINVSSGSVLGEMVAITGLGLYLGASSNNFLSFITNGSSRMDITAGGNVLIATATDAGGYKLQVKGLQQLKGDNTLLNFGELDTNNVYFQSLNTGANASKGFVFYGAAEYMRIASSGNLLLNTTTDAGYKLDVNGTARISGALTATGGITSTTGLALSGGSIPASGIQFPGTQVASANNNNLDDYEEGTWTMGVSFGGGTTGITYSSNTGQYTKVGRQVTVTGYLLLTNKGTATGAALITGLPFTVGTAVSFYSGLSSVFVNISSTGYNSGYGNVSNTNIQLIQTSVLGATTNLTDTNFANNSGFLMSLTYFV